MLKKVLRTTYILRRNSLSQSQGIDQSISIANRLLTLPVWKLDYYHIFLPIIEKKEIDTSVILSILQGKDKHILIPKVLGQNNLQHFLLTDNTKFVVSSWGVPEPLDGISISVDKIDVVFVPLLAFDKKGHRVGYGKGFYDTFLSQCRKNVIKIGLSFFEAEETITDVRNADVRLDYCVTPNTIYSFNTF
ncbi:5-formyltetrahydrofolate cyclo-ligase [Maribacter antarcticus]|uniref:5-formyltetrahydrofolate cyclo-ligase n=1 Tax=Maribacter antarcticus TaxID=505250 RepID=UPI00047A1002|nr:5-formyltetrahydrofolate cyclo-ligase [Maribacter antarcticus]